MPVERRKKKSSQPHGVFFTQERGPILERVWVPRFPTLEERRDYWSGLPIVTKFNSSSS
jgi:hypothetical protein